jgi:ABC-type glutathione transport system ATPase component
MMRHRFSILDKGRDRPVVNDAAAGEISHPREGDDSPQQLEAIGSSAHGCAADHVGKATHSAAPYLRIEGLTKRFGGFTALADLSLEIFEREFVCFLGPSGCGKTTFLRAIAGLDVQSSGRIEQAGRDISALPPAERDFGIVFQS